MLHFRLFTVHCSLFSIHCCGNGGERGAGRPPAGTKLLLILSPLSVTDLHQSLNPPGKLVNQGGWGREGSGKPAFSFGVLGARGAV